MAWPQRHIRPGRPTSFVGSPSTRERVPDLLRLHARGRGESTSSSSSDTTSCSSTPTVASGWIDSAARPAAHSEAESRAPAINSVLNTPFTTSSTRAWLRSSSPIRSAAPRRSIRSTHIVERFDIGPAKCVDGLFRVADDE